MSAEDLILQMLTEIDQGSSAEDRPTTIVDPTTPFEVLYNEVIEEDTESLFASADDTPLDPHRPGRTSFYFFVGYISPTVDGASSLRRNESLDNAPIHRIALTYEQAKSLDLVR